MDITIDLDSLELFITKAYEKGSYSVREEEYACYDDYSISMRATEYAKEVVKNLKKIGQK